MNNASALIARDAIKKLDREVLLSRKTKTSIAEELGAARTTVHRRLKRDDMDLGAFIGTALAVGADPRKLIDEAMEEK